DYYCGSYWSGGIYIF
nr:immunoglobulin light chain junction region [Macaca mulatta]